MAWWESVQIDSLGESAFILRNLGEVSPAGIAQALEGRAEIQDAAPSYETVGIYPSAPMELEAVRRLLSRLDLAAAAEPKFHEIPVCYDIGEDLAEASVRLGLSIDELTQFHSGASYQCFAVGFQPGFPYLGYLPDRIAGLPRRDSPRTRVPAGSVGITGRQTGIYPSETPGGWWLLGRTPLTIVDPRDAYFPISAGDEIRFVPITPAEFQRRLGRRL